ncbi:predicted protein [Postia placenta Mad-698-R]|nr:predicted protein [Postia placenta Mad-698-R]
MALICRHDIPIFLANVDTPGKQQKYAIALLEHLFTFLPPNATVAALYDIGCVVNRSLELYNILPVDIHQRLIFAISAMHAYSHQWACQIVYNPRLHEGLGLTDGEGVERLWSRLRKLIPITRSSAQSRRIWLIDRQAKVISLDLRDDLGHWIAQRLRHGVESREASSLEELVRVDAPAHLKKELDIVLSLQADLDTVNKAIETTRTVLENGEASAESHEVEALYSSLNITDSFPDFGNVSLEFVRLLLMACDLKINIRKRAVGSFFEWDQLDQAVGGQHNPLGTKIHQQTRKAIAKRTPALKTVIRKFNRYCKSLKELKQPEWTITLPLPLPTDLDALRDDASLLADVWIDPSQAQAPRWLEDVDIRKALGLSLAHHRFGKNQSNTPSILQRRKADNICRWYGSELAAAKLALATSSNHTRVEMVNSALGDPQVYAWPFVIETPLPYIIHQDDTDPYRRLEEEEPSYLEAEQHLVEDVFLDNASGDKGPPEDARSEASVMTITMTWETPIHVSIDDAPHFLQAMAPVLSQSLQSNVHLDVSDMSRLQNRTPPTRLPGSRRERVVSSKVSRGSSEHEKRLRKRLRTLGKFLRQLSKSKGSSRLYRRVNAVDEVSKLRGEGQSDAVASLDAGRTRLMSSELEGGNGSCIFGEKYDRFYTTQDATTIQEWHMGTRGFALFLKNLPHQEAHTKSIVRADAGDATLWRNAASTRFWEKDVWTIPIHYEDHWMLATIDIPRSRVAYFDSFAREHPWEGHIQDVMQLTACLLNIAADKGHRIVHAQRAWAVYPTTHNTYNCGVWILAIIAAVLRGYNMTGFEEADIGRFRIFLFTLARAVST